MLFLVESFQYRGDALEFFPTAEGYVDATGGQNSYVFHYRDHLGNIRLAYTQPKPGEPLVIMEEHHYYPFGMKHANYNDPVHNYIDNPDGTGYADVAQVAQSKYRYRFNGQEWQDELGLNMTAMDYRPYDNALGRFHSVDALAEWMPDMTPYRFGFNNPVVWNDPSGLFETRALAMQHISQFGLSNASVSYNEARGYWEISNEGYNFWHSSSGDLWFNYSSAGGAEFINLGGSGGGYFGNFGDNSNQLFYREKGAQRGEFLNFNNSLLNRFNKSKLKPEAAVVGSDRNIEIMKVIESVEGLKELYKAMGSPKISDYGRSSQGYRGFTFPNNTIAIYNGAFTNYFWLASTIFHELTHVYQNKGLPVSINREEQQAYRVEWKLADPSLIRNYKDMYKSIWNRTYGYDKPFPY